MNALLGRCKTLGVLVFLFSFNSVSFAQEAEKDTQIQETAEASKSTRAVPKDYSENYAFDDPKQRQTFLKLTEELRCPKCQNQNIADSDAMIAHDMRRKVYQLMQDGNGEAEVIDFMKTRYGDFVHYQPPVNAATIWLWLLPILFVGVMAFVFVRRRNVENEDDIEQKLAKAEELLKGTK